MYRPRERRDGRLDIAGREGALVLADDVGLLKAPSGCNSGSRVACAPLNGQLLKYTRSSTMPGVLVAVGGKGQGELDAPMVAVDVKDDPPRTNTNTWIAERNVTIEDVNFIPHAALRPTNRPNASAP